MIRRFKLRINMPYSLHDMVVNRIAYKNESVYLEFENGFESAEGDCTQADGKLVVENVDMDSSYALLLSKLGGYGGFDGVKMPLDDFIGQYGKCRFEIIDELYGFEQAEYIGYLHLPEDGGLMQTSLLLYFNGDVVYDTEK